MGELKKAQLIELVPSGERWEPGEKTVTVQFNPVSLKVTYTNQLSGGDQAGGSAKQFVGQSTTKMALELWFDTTGDQSDVRLKTAEVAYFLTPKAGTQEGKSVNIPPRVRFSWGAFLFEGFVDSMDETIEFWSEKGIPLRASVSLSLSEQAFQFRRDESAAGATGTKPATAARSGETLQDLVSRAGSGAKWQRVAEQNGVDNPRHLPAGEMFVFDS